MLEVLFQRLYNAIKSSKLIRETDVRWKRRFGCVIAAPLLAMSAMSNFYFFAGYDVGNIFVRKHFQSMVYQLACYDTYIFIFR